MAGPFIIYFEPQRLAGSPSSPCLTATGLILEGARHTSPSWLIRPQGEEELASLAQDSLCWLALPVSGKVGEEQQQQVARKQASLLWLGNLSIIIL